MELFLILFSAVFGIAVLVLVFVNKKKQQREQEEREKREKEEAEKPKIDPKQEKLEKQRQKELIKQKQREEKRAKNMKATPQPMEEAEFSVYIGNTTPNSFSFSDDGKYFIVACNNRQNVLFEASSLTSKKNPIQRYKFVDDQVVAIDLINRDDGLYEAVCGLDRARGIKSFIVNPKDAKTRDGIFDVPNAAKMGITQLKVSRDHQYVIAFNDETYISAFNPNGTMIIKNDSHQMKNYEMSRSSDSNFFALSSYTSEVIVIGVKRGKDGLPNKATKAFTVAGHKNSIVSIDFHPKEKKLITGSIDGHFNIWTTPQRWEEGDDFIKQIESYAVEKEEQIKMVRQNPANDIIAVLMPTNVLYFYEKGKLLKTIPKVHSLDVAQLEWTPDGKYIVALSTGSCFLYAFSCP